MSRATLYVKFPDGSLRYGLYNGTDDFAWTELTAAPHMAWNGEQDSVEPGPEVSVAIATDYGGGFAWEGTATKKALVKGTLVDDNEDVVWTDRTLPSWAVYPDVG